MWVSHPIKFTFVVERFQHSIHYISRQQIGWTHLSIIAKDGRIAKDRLEGSAINFTLTLSINWQHVIHSI